MGNLKTFDDDTIARAREKFTNGKRGSGDDPIATHSKVAQDVLLGHLGALLSRAENKAYATHAGLQGELDGHALIDPFLSYDENVAQIRDKYGVNYETYRQAEIERETADAESKAQRHARERLIEEYDAIESGERSQLVDDIRAEFGDEWVDSVLARERALRTDPQPGLPDDEPKPEVEPGATPEPTLEATPKPTPEATREPKPAPAGSPGILEGLGQVAVALAILLGSFLSSAKTGVSLTLSAFFEVFGTSRKTAGNELATVAEATREVAEKRENSHV